MTGGPRPALIQPANGRINPAATLMECNRPRSVEQLRSRECAMRLAFWRAGKDKTVVQRAVAKPAPVVTEPVAATETGDLDLHALGQALKRKRGWIIFPTVLAAILSINAVHMITPPL